MPSRFIRLVSILLLVFMGGCKKTDDGSDMDADAPNATEASSASAPVASSVATVSSVPALPQEPAPLELLELTFTTEVKNKEPSDVLLAAEPGKRVWAHLRLRHRGDEQRKIHLEFHVNGEKRTTLDLKVEKSWSFRTWAFNTLLAGDKKGVVGLKVTDDAGLVLADTSIPIAGKAKTKPYERKGK